MAAVFGPAFDWTPESVVQLKALWADGLSAGAIAAEMGGLSRNAVIGKVHRLGLTGRAVMRAPRAPAPPRPQRQAPFRPSAPKPPPQPKYAAPKKAATDDDTGLESDGITDIVEDTDIPVAQRKTLIELRADSCRWPVGDPASSDFFFCGDTSAKRSDVKPMPYCPKHCARAFGVAAPRRQMTDAERATRAMQGRKNLAAYKQALASGER